MILKVLKETVENADNQFLQWLEVNLRLFCNIVENDLLGKTKSIRWDDLIIRCEWKADILKFIEESNIGPSQVLD